MEYLQITAGERRVLLILMCLYMLTWGASLFAPSGSVFDQEYYEPVILEFERLSEVRRHEREVVLARYFPPADSGDVFFQSLVEDKEIILHTAMAAELVRLPGIGPVTAERIIEYRDQFGPLRQPEDLLNVPGIGPATLNRIRDYLIFDLPD